MITTERIGIADADRLLRTYRRKPLFSPTDLADQVAYGPEIVTRLLPHRKPMLFVDRITAMDIERGIIAGGRYLSDDDPVFAGHFPGYPLYPGTFQVEMVGQLGLCLHYFTSEGSVAAPTEETPPAVRATRILGAYYGEPLEPGVEVTLLAQVLATDGYFASMIGQCLVGDRVTSVSAGEVLFLE